MNKSPTHNPISYEGVKRRDQILRLAICAARSRKRRRSVILAVTVNAVFVVIATITALVARQMPLHNRELVTGPPPTTAIPHIEPAAPPVGVQIEYLLTDPTITDRLSIAPEAPIWQTIDDDQLIQLFADAGQQVGIVTANGKTFLMTR